MSAVLVVDQFREQSLHLDYTCFTGQPLTPLSPLIEGVPITFKVQLQRWRTPYASKHAYNLSFSLKKKTFRIGSWNDKNHWFIVMHPINTGSSNLANNIDRLNRGIKSSALTEDLADTMSHHIKDRLQEVVPGLDLQQETVELNYAEWGRLQLAIFSSWNLVRAPYADKFWHSHQPVLHCYEFGQDLTLDDDNPQLLSKQLGERINLSQVETFLFAIAANLYFWDEEPEAEEDCWFMSAQRRRNRNYNESLSALCWLPELKRREYPVAKARRGLKLFPLAFSSQYGNFQAATAPQFLLQKYGDPVYDQTAEENSGRAIVMCSATQGYSILKQDIRKTPKHFLPSKGFYIGGWAMPEKHLNNKQVVKMQALQANAHPKSKRERPILREMSKIQTVLNQGRGRTGFRLEPIIHVNVGSLQDQNRNWDYIADRTFEPLFDFWNNEGPTFRRTIRLFPKDVFPGILLPIGKIMDGALQYLRSEAILHAEKHLCTAQAEACSIIEQLAAYSMNGNGTYTRSKTFRFLGIRESIKALQFPYISDNHLDIQMKYMSYDLWPRHRTTGRPLLAHLAALKFHHGEEAAESRRLEIEHLDFKEYQFDDSAALKEYIHDRVLLHLVPELRRFVKKALARHGAQLRKKIILPVDDGAEYERDNEAYEGQLREQRERDSLLKAFRTHDQPFSQEFYEPLFCKYFPAEAENAIAEICSTQFFNDLVRALKETDGKGISRFLPKGSRWCRQIHWLISTSGDGQGSLVLQTGLIVRILEKSFESAGIKTLPGFKNGRLAVTCCRRLVSYNDSSSTSSLGEKHRPSTYEITRGALAHGKMRAHEPSLPSTGEVGFRLPFAIPLTGLPALIRKGLDTLRKSKVANATRKALFFNRLRQLVNYEDPDIQLIVVTAVIIGGMSRKPKAQVNGLSQADGSMANEPYMAFFLPKCMFYIRPSLQQQNPCESTFVDFNRHKAFERYNISTSLLCTLPFFNILRTTKGKINQRQVPLLLDIEIDNLHNLRARLDRWTSLAREDRLDEVVQELLGANDNWVADALSALSQIKNPSSQEEGYFNDEEGSNYEEGLEDLLSDMELAD